MQFVWKQVCDFLYPVDQVSLRVSCQLTAECISMCRVYAFANKLIAKELANDNYCNAEMRQHMKTGFMYGSFLTSLLFGIDMGDFITSLPEIIVCYLTNTLCMSYDYHGDDGMYLIHSASYREYESKFAYITQRCVFEFNRVIYEHENVYVANWNALIERSCNVTQITNPQKFNCFNSIKTGFMQSMYHFRSLGFNIDVDFASFYQDTCIHCRRKRRSLCIDSTSDAGDNMDIHDLLLEDDNNDGDYKMSNFERLAKIRSRQRTIMRKKKMLANKAQQQLTSFRFLKLHCNSSIQM